MLKDDIKKCLIEAVKSLQNRGIFSVFNIGEIIIERPENERFGDFSTNFAFKIANFIKRNPIEIAHLIADEIKRNTNEFIKVEAVKPGFINFFVKDEVLQKELKNILSEKERYAIFNRKGKVNIEFISANPTGELHLGHGRGAFYGDVLANVLAKAGYKIEREFFVNNAKNNTQIKELGKTVLGKSESYKTNYLKLKVKSLKLKIEKIKKKMPENLLESEVGFFMAGEILKDIKNFIGKKLKIKFDKWFTEQELFGKFLNKTQGESKVEKIYNDLKKNNFIYEKEGAVWIKTSQYGDDEDRVIVRSTGEPTYFLTDIAYHFDKFKRGYDKVIDIWGADHQGHVKRMFAVKKMLNQIYGSLASIDLDILISQMVGLKSRDKYLKFSKRKGQIITLEWLIDEIGLDAARFFYLTKSLDTQMEIDLDLAKEQSEKNPIFYIQYAHARIASIFRKAKTRIKNKELKIKDLELLTHKSELSLIKKLSQWPEIIEDSANDYEVHRLTTYVYELAKSFSQFYRDCKVISDDKELSAARFSLSFATQIVLKDVLKILGINALNKM